MPKTVSDKKAKTVVPNIADCTDGVTPQLENIDLGAAAFVLSGGNAAQASEKSSVSENVSNISQCEADFGPEVAMMTQTLSSLSTVEEKVAMMCIKYLNIFERLTQKDESVRELEKKVMETVGKALEANRRSVRVAMFKRRIDGYSAVLNEQNKAMNKKMLLLVDLVVRHIVMIMSKHDGDDEEDHDRVDARLQAMESIVSSNFSEFTARLELQNEDQKEMSLKILKLNEESVTREKLFKTMMERQNLHKKIWDLQVEKIKEEGELCMKKLLLLQNSADSVNGLCSYYRNHEEDLRLRITFYFKTLKELQSNFDLFSEVFKIYREILRAMTEKIKMLENSSARWKKTSERLWKLNKGFALEGKNRSDEIDQLHEKVSRLTGLSQALQAERLDLAAQVKALENTKPSTVQQGD